MMVQEDRWANPAKADLSKLLNPAVTQTEAGKSDLKSTAVEKSLTEHHQSRLNSYQQYKFIHTHTHICTYMEVMAKGPVQLCTSAEYELQWDERAQHNECWAVLGVWLWVKTELFGYLGPERNAEFLNIRPQASLWIWPWECTNFSSLTGKSCHWGIIQRNKKSAMLCLKTE